MSYEEPKPTLSYGEYDPPLSENYKKSVVKYFGWVVLITVIGGVGWVGYRGTANLEHAALHAVGTKVKEEVVLESVEGEKTTITHENRKWLSNIASKRGDK